MPIPSEELIPVSGSDGPWLDDGPTTPRESEQEVARALPVAPPGQHRVAKTIMGVGMPELQALFKEKLGDEPAPAKPAVASAAKPAPARPAPATPAPAAPPRAPAVPPRAAATPQRAPAPASEASPWDLDLAAPTQPHGPTVEDVHGLVGTDELRAFAEGPTDAAAAAAAAASDAPPPVPQDATAPPLPEPPTRPPAPPAVRPAPVARPRPAPTARASGPSNWVLIALWVVAILSVGLAVYLYVR
jgi:hypothetical protein